MSFLTCTLLILILGESEWAGAWSWAAYWGSAATRGKKKKIQDMVVTHRTTCTLYFGKKKWTRENKNKKIRITQGACGLIPFLRWMFWLSDNKIRLLFACFSSDIGQTLFSTPLSVCPPSRVLHGLVSRTF